MKGSRAPNSASPPLKFFALVLVLSLPFWIAGGVSGLELLPGLPASALAAVTPAIAATILVSAERGVTGVKGLLGRAFDYGLIKPKAWYAPILLLMPAVMALSYGLMHWAGVPLPAPELSLLSVLLLFLGFFAGGVGEELGWSGYAIEPLQHRWGALGASILLGAIWVGWHIVPLLQAHRPLAWVAWWSLGTIALRVLTTWIYNNTGKSVFAASLFHAISNLSWMLFPTYGSHYDPRITAPIIAGAAAIVAFIWGPRTLTQPTWQGDRRQAS